MISASDAGTGTDERRYIEQCLFLPTSNGKSGGSICQAWETIEHAKVTFVKHNTYVAGSSSTLEAAVIVGGADQIANQVGTDGLTHNIFYRNASPHTGTYVASNHPLNFGQPEVTDSLPAAACHHNCHKGFDVSPAGRFSGRSGDTDIEAGTVYSSPMSGSTAPGAHDLVNVDPQFLDGTRNIQKWAVTQGCSNGATDAQKFAYALAICQADKTQIAVCTTWIFAGYAPTNIALKNAASDGASTMGAVEGSFPSGPSGFGDQHGGFSNPSGGFIN